MHKLLLKECFIIINRAFFDQYNQKVRPIKKFAQSLDTFGFIHYLCTDLSHGRTLRGGQPKLGSSTFFGGAFVIFSSLF